MNDELRRIKESVSIIEYARLKGFTPKKIGRYYTLKEHDSVRIDPERNLFFRNSTGQSGSVIDFAIVFTGKSLKAAIRELSLMSGRGARGSGRAMPPRKPLQKKGLTLPAKAATMQNVFAYLVKTRKIDANVVREMVDRDMLYQDTHNNCVFISYDKSGNAAFAIKRGTNTHRRFVGDVPGCDYSRGFFIDNKAKNLVVCESVIDAMSFMELLEKEGKSHSDYSYLALSGTSKGDDALQSRIEENDFEKVLLCLDNDEAGAYARERLKKLIMENFDSVCVEVMLPQEGKDFNDYLRALKEMDTFRSRENQKVQEEEI